MVLLDDRMVAEGKAAGRKDGKARGFKEGEGMGRGKGFQTAAEMGFYRGCCLAWLSLHDDDPGAVKVKFLLRQVYFVGLFIFTSSSKYHA